MMQRFHPAGGSNGVRRGVACRGRLQLGHTGRSATGGARSAGELPASFEGDLPCADCEGIRYHLDSSRTASSFSA
jgi:hypothetical protein